MKENELLKQIVQINRWWDNHPVPPTIKKADSHRKQFFELSRTIYEKRIVAITGPRQVGKTTLMGQLIERQISEGVPKDRIIYIPVDNELLKFYSEDEGILMGVLSVYSKRVISEDLSNIEKPIFVYLDEIQDLPNWSKMIKSYYDIYPKIHFVITGSSHTLLQQGIFESLVGRIRIRTLLPLKFSEYVSFTMGWSETSDEAFTKRFIWPLKKSLNSSIGNQNAVQFWNTLERNRSNIANYSAALKKSVKGFLVRGGYPHSISSSNDFEAGLNLKQDLDLTIYKDINRLFKTRDPSKLMDLLIVMAREGGKPISQNYASRQIGSDWKNVDSYMRYLQQVFMISKARAWGTPEYKSTKSDAIYISDNGIRNILLSQFDDGALINDMHNVYSGAVASHVIRLKLRFSNFQNSDVYYWESDDDYVDFIIDKPHVFPIGVCMDDGKIDNKKSSLNRFMKANNCNFGMVITEDKTEIDDKIICLPAWIFLSLC